MDSAAASIMLGVERDWIQKVGLVLFCLKISSVSISFPYFLPNNHYGGLRRRSSADESDMSITDSVKPNFPLGP